MGRLSPYILSTTSTHFTDIQTLARLLLERVHLCTQLAAGIEHGTFGTRSLEFTLSTFALVAAVVRRMVKVGLSPSKKVCVICLIENPIKMIKNYFCFILKALFVLKIFKFCHDVLVMQEKRLDQKNKFNFKIHDVTTWFTNNCNTHIATYNTHVTHTCNTQYLTKQR